MSRHLNNKEGGKEGGGVVHIGCCKRGQYLQWVFRNIREGIRQLVAVEVDFQPPIADPVAVCRHPIGHLQKHSNDTPEVTYVRKEFSFIAFIKNSSIQYNKHLKKMTIISKIYTYM